MVELSIIIPFANEGVEVERTIKSIIEHSDIKIPIILINDASNDGFEYDGLANLFGLTYIKNQKRLGVAQCRDLGVTLCKTPYFILLDAHMRFYDKNWYNLIIEKLKNEKKLLLCCQTRNIAINHLVKKEKNKQSMGAFITFFSEDSVLDATWNYTEKCINEDFEEIPCVLGAAYAASREYWTFLKGLSGLYGYGCDEAYISMKVWLSGGRCLLAKNVIIGHLYRDAFPYTVRKNHYLYNQLFITYVLCDVFMYSNVIAKLKFDYRLYPLVFEKSYKEMERKKNENNELKKYYKSILNNNIFLDYYAWNNTYLNMVEHNNIKTEKELDNLAIRMIFNMNKKNIGLFSGLMSYVLFFSHYAQYKQNSFFEEFSFTILENIFENINPDTSIGFANGLSGIGWGVEYLVANKLMNGDTNMILSDIDLKIASYRLNDMTDLTLSTGVVGLLHYLYVRLYNNSFLKNSMTNDIKKVAKKIILSQNSFSGVNIAVKILDLINNGNHEKYRIDIKDLFFIERLQNEDIIGLSLYGLIGDGIRFITKQNEY